VIGNVTVSERRVSGQYCFIAAEKLQLTDYRSNEVRAVKR